MRIGVVGYGAVAAIHVKGLQRRGANVCCVYGPNADKAKTFAAGNGVAHSTTEIDAIFSESDAVIIASPSARHFEQAEAALRAGRHCLVELPACSSAAEAHTLSRLAGSGALTLQCAHTTRFLAGIRRVGEWLQDGVLGEMQHIISLRAIPPRVRSWLDDAVLRLYCCLIAFLSIPVPRDYVVVRFDVAKPIGSDGVIAAGDGEPRLLKPRGIADADVHRRSVLQPRHESGFLWTIDARIRHACQRCQ